MYFNYYLLDLDKLTFIKANQSKSQNTTTASNPDRYIAQKV